MPRYLTPFVLQDLKRKMIFIGGPRQVGKTTFAKDMGKGWPGGSQYFNWDNTTHRDDILHHHLPAEPNQLIILDEIHKYGRWRNLVKGLHDVNAERGVRYCVTGSARLDLYRRGGDSLQGRYHYYRLHPFSLKEAGGGRQVLENLFLHSGFPEPFFAAQADFTRRWSKEYRTRVMQEDVRDLENVRDLSLMELLATRLPALVGSPLSFNGLREDIQVAHRTISRWVDILERMYFIFRIYPYGSSKLRAVKKEAKHYHYDWSVVTDEGIRFENMVANHLLKWCHFTEDTAGHEMELRYFRDVDKREVDFVVLRDGKAELFVEVKLSAQEPTPALRYLKERHVKVRAVQVHLRGEDDYVSREGIAVMPAEKFLMELI